MSTSKTLMAALAILLAATTHAAASENLIFALGENCTFSVFTADGGKIVDTGVLRKGQKRVIPSMGMTAVCVDHATNPRGNIILEFPSKK